MKKILNTIILLMLFGVVNVNAASVSTSLSCPANAAAGSKATCTLKATPSGVTLNGFEMKYTFSPTDIYSEFNVGTGFTTQSKNASGAILLHDGFSSQVTVGTLVVTMPSSGSASITIRGIKSSFYPDPSDESNVDSLSAADVSKTIRVSSTANTLTSLSITGGTLSPAFNANTTSYKATVSAATTNISATKEDASYGSVSGTGSKNLNYGDNTFNIVVTPESGSAKTYTIVINRPDTRDTENKLKTLSLSDGTLSPTFASNTLTYTSTVASNIEKISFNATLISNKSSFVDGYGPREVKLNYGANTFKIIVISEREEKKEYTIKITRTDGRSTNNYLKSLTTSEGVFTFNKNTNTYAFSVANNITEITVGADAEDSKSKVTGTGKIKLKEGINTITIKVTAENEKVKNYTLTVTRLTKSQELSSNTNLTKLEIKDQNFTFDPEIFEYNLKLEDEASLVFDYLTEDTTSVVTIEGNENLKNGSIIEVKVTSTDGTVKIYKINIQKEVKEIVTNTPQNDEEDVPWGKILLGVLSVLVIAGVIVVFVIKNKKNKQKEQVIVNTDLNQNNNISQDIPSVNQNINQDIPNNQDNEDNQKFNY